MLVYPSFFEGFGIPLVEAMWSGCPIVCSNTSCLPEIAGDAAVLVDPRSNEELSAAIIRVAGDPALREQLIEKGRKRAEQFTWRNFTLNTVRILHEVVHDIA
jgi:alpha-1,3-rhamnosyl/mannosyltransferase